MSDFNPLLAESALVHRVTVDRLKWELGEPIPWLPPSGLYNPRYYYYYNDYPYGYPWAGAAVNSQYHYSLGFRDGLKSVNGSSGGSGSRASSSPGAARERNESPTAAAPAAVTAACGNQRAKSAAAYPGDLMGFPSASYRRPLCAYPVSTDTSYDDLTLGWPYGCKPFYFRHADPPSVRFCWN